MIRKFLSLSIVDILALGIPIVVLPILAKKLSIDDFSTMMVILILHQIGNQCIDYSFNYLAAREKEEDQSIGFQTGRYIISIIYLFTSYIIVKSLEYNEISENFIPIICIPIIAYSINPTWLYYKKGKMHKLSIINLCYKISFAFLVTIYLNTENFYQTIYIYSAIILAISLSSKISEGNKFEFKLKAGKERLRKGFNIFIIDFSPQFYVTIPLLASKIFLTETAFACLTLAVRIYNAGSTAQWSLLKVYLKPLKINFEKNFKSMVITSLILSALQILVVLTTSEYIIYSLFSIEYKETINLLTLLSASFLFISIRITFGYAFHILKNIEESYKNQSLLMALTMPFVMFYLIYWYNEYGYIYGILLSHTFLSIFNLNKFIREMKK